MKAVFRVDASEGIGAGHVMRCLSLVSALSAQDVACSFISRKLPKGIEERVARSGITVHTISPHEPSTPSDWEWDAAQTQVILERESPDWLIVDHYALDARWQRASLPDGVRLMVIDDLADREHRADILLDQNLGRRFSDYDPYLPEKCIRLIGPRYALLRPEYAKLRTAALDARYSRIANGNRNILVSFGGSDPNGVTSSVLNALRECELPKHVQVTVVMGASATTLAEVSDIASKLLWKSQILVDVDDMASLIAKADIGIGGAGSSTWERCALGLPSIVSAVAPNQRSVLQELVKRNAVIVLDTFTSSGLGHRLCRAIDQLLRQEIVMDMAQASGAICDGNGAPRVATVICEHTNQHIVSGGMLR